MLANNYQLSTTITFINTVGDLDMDFNWQYVVYL